MGHRYKYALSQLLLVALAVFSKKVGAQRPPWLKEPYLKPAVYGRITDSVSGLPIAGARMRVDSLMGIPGSDNDGWYLLFAVPPGTRRVEFYCPSRRRFSKRKIATRVVFVRPGADSVVNFQVPLTGCDEPPVHTWTGEFRGHYTSGFESSDFTPCQPLEPLDGTAYEGQQQFVWVEFSDEGFKTDHHRWPDPGSDPYPSVYVRWRATVTGPGGYGHLGVGMYQMRVERILEVRKPTESDCR